MIFNPQTASEELLLNPTKHHRTNSSLRPSTIHSEIYSVCYWMRLKGTDIAMVFYHLKDSPSVEVHMPIGVARADLDGLLTWFTLEDGRNYWEQLVAKGFECHTSFSTHIIPVRVRA